MGRIDDFAQLAPNHASVDRLKVTGAVQALRADSREEAKRNWRRSLASRLTQQRPDLADTLATHLGVAVHASHTPEPNPLSGLSIGELAVVYEALLATSDPQARRRDGQYFTPDDVAAFMAAQANEFPPGTWLDPCCGVGNLSWHLSNAQADPSAFVQSRLTLVDIDDTALASAQVLLAASFARPGATEVLKDLSARCCQADFLAATTPVESDFVLMNPPYGRTQLRDDYQLGPTRELFAYFMEKVCTSAKGFVAVTPAAYLNGARYGPLRDLLEDKGGKVYVFDNVPDTVFRGYKYGSSNTSRTNFVRACITVVKPGEQQWRITPIIRWGVASRAKMWAGIEQLLAPLRKSPGGRWAKLMPGTERLWTALQDRPRLRDLLASEPTEHQLWVASTPRYYISASGRPLKRASVHVLNFETPAEWAQAYLLLNSSLSYWWWRTVDGGINLQRRTLESIPLPPELTAVAQTGTYLVEQLRISDEDDVRIKLNAGRRTENVKRPAALIQELDHRLLLGIDYDFSLLRAPDMFDDPSERHKNAQPSA